MGPLSTRPKPRFPVALGRQRQDHPIPPASPASKPCPPRESVRTRPELPRTRVAVTLLGFFPSRDLVRASETSTRQTARLDARRPATQRTVSPPRQVSPPLRTNTMGRPRRQQPIPYGPDRTASRRRFLLPRPSGLEPEPLALACDSARASTRSLTLTRPQTDPGPRSF
jgi:hypothetical protein